MKAFQKLTGSLFLTGAMLTSPTLLQAEEPQPEEVVPGYTEHELREITQGFVIPEGYGYEPGELIPVVFHIYLKPVPDHFLKYTDDPAPGEIVRQWDDTIYYLDKDTYEVLDKVNVGKVALR